MRTFWLRAIALALIAGVFAVRPMAAGEPTKKELETSQNNLKQIMLAVINSSDANNGRMPMNITDKDGRPLLSWRVAILPYIEQDNLYKAFKLDEPWDSDHNKKLIEKMPKLYAPVRVKAKAGETFYQTFFGEGALYGSKNAPTFPASITDGTVNTVFVVEAGDPVIWSRPVDLPFAEKRPLPKLGGLFDGDFHVGMCDGSVMRFKKDYDLDEMIKAIMPADGNVIDFGKLTK
ncbi:hypothetical protein VT84_27975 [Gemmata sp. SH-PL17]|nr:hypothetical protein VT84_27975 [Gemmata sp. SH-PL17]